MIIDAHTHIFPERFRTERAVLINYDRTFRELYANPSAKMVTGNELLSAMDEAEIDISVIAGVGWENIEIAKEANEYILEVCSRHPNRFIGLASVNPAWGDLALTELQRYVGSGIGGVGELHPSSQGFDLDDFELVSSLVDLTTIYKLPILVHSSEPVGHLYPGKGKIKPQVLLKFISQFPEAKIICAHWGGGLPFYALMPEVIKMLKNVYFDSAASSLLYNRKIFSVVENLVGPEKLLFASDYPLVNPLRLIDQIVGSGLSTKAQELILGQNSSRLFGVTG